MSLVIMPNIGINKAIKYFFRIFGDIVSP